MKEAQKITVYGDSLVALVNKYTLMVRWAKQVV